jgi:hypothetical protein
MKNSSTPGMPRGRPIQCFTCKKLGHRRNQCPQLVGNSPVTSPPNNTGSGNAIPEVDPGTTGEPIDCIWLMGASRKELLLHVEVEGQPHQFFIDSGASLSC